LQGHLHLAGLQVAARGLQRQITGATPHPSLGCPLGQALEDGCGLLILSCLEQALSAV